MPINSRGVTRKIGLSWQVILRILKEGSRTIKQSIPSARSSVAGRYDVYLMIPTRFRGFGGGDDWLLSGLRPCGAGVATTHVNNCYDSFCLALLVGHLLVVISIQAPHFGTEKRPADISSPFLLSHSLREKDDKALVISAILVVIGKAPLLQVYGRRWTLILTQTHF